MYQPDTKKLYHGTVNDATRELARIIYEVAKAHDLQYATACAFNDGGKNDRGSAHAQLRSGYWTDCVEYDPPVKEATDGQG